MPIVLVGVFVLLLSVLSGYAVKDYERYKTDRLLALQSAQAFLISEAQRYLRQEGVWPSSMAALSAVGGFEHLRAYVPTSAGGTWLAPYAPWDFVVSNNFSQGGWRYQRLAAVVSLDGKPASSFLSTPHPDCASGGNNFAQNPAWCAGPSNARVAIRSSLPISAERLTQATEVQARTARKLQRFYRAGNPLPSNTTATALRTLVTNSYGTNNVGTNADSCVGQFSWQGMGLECQDLYNAHGNAVSYRRLTATSFELSSPSTVLSSTGTPIQVITTVQL